MFLFNVEVKNARISSGAHVFCFGFFLWWVFLPVVCLNAKTLLYYALLSFGKIV